MQQLGSIDFRVTELIHHLTGSWKALYWCSEDFRNDFRRFGIITAFHAFDAVPPWQLINCFDIVYEALIPGGLLLVRFNKSLSDEAPEAEVQQIDSKKDKKKNAKKSEKL
jgi:hypothetical protein